jgi:hypothetical protein
MLKQFLTAANDVTPATAERLNELEEIDVAELSAVSGGIGTVTIANPTP